MHPSIISLNLIFAGEPWQKNYITRFNRKELKKIYSGPADEACVRVISFYKYAFIESYLCFSGINCMKYSIPWILKAGFI